MLQGRDILIISSIDWNFLWQGHQEIATRLARAGNRVVYVENLGVRSPKLREIGRVLRRARSFLKRSGLPDTEEEIRIISPIVLPPFLGRLSQTVNRWLLKHEVIRTIESIKFREVIVWTFLPTDTGLILLELLRHRTASTIYYLIADFKELANRTEPLLISETRLLKSCDIVFAQEESLASRARTRNRNVHIFPFGVSLEAFPAGVPVAEELNHIRGEQPIIGYIGGLHKHLDLDLLSTCCALKPEWTWIFVGATQTDVAALKSLPNVKLVGQRPHHELAGWLSGMDVAIVPYKRTAYTDSVVPTKINEYLAAGKPVVTTDLPSIASMAKEGSVTSVQASPEDFISAIQMHLSQSPDESDLLLRREAAGRSDWEVRLEEMSNLILNSETIRRTRSLKGEGQET